jgi:cation:H+ antiporter
VLLVLYALYVFFVIFTQRHKNPESLRYGDGMLRPVGLFFVGALLLVGASEIIIYLASSLSAQLSVAPFIIGLFAIAFSTSLPELTYGIRVALARDPELSLGDVVGSSVVNALGVLGLVAVIHPITPAVPSAALMTGFFGIAVYLGFFFIAGRQKVAPIYGAILLVLYLLFVSLNFLI